MFDVESLRGKVVWLTGAAGGLGPGIAHRLAHVGLKLALHYHTNQKRARELAGELTREGVEVTVTGGDLAEPGVAESTVAHITELLGAPYGLVHLAGPFVRKPVVEHTREEFDRMLSGNLTSLFEAAKAVVPGMRKASAGRIVSIAMANAHITLPMRLTGPHLAAKSGVVALSRTLALEEGKYGITVNSVSPGNIQEKEIDRETAHARGAAPSFPMGHPGSFEDLADAILFLMSPAASYITGAVLEVTGGWMGDDWHPHPHR